MSSQQVIVKNIPIRNTNKNTNKLSSLLELHPYAPWCSYSLSKNPALTFDTVLKNPGIAWDWSEISRNPCVTMDIVLKHPGFDWNYKLLSENPSITWDDIKNNFGLDWYYRNVCKNPNVTLDIIKNNPHLFNFNFGYFYIHNPNCDWDFIESYINENNFTESTFNLFIVRNLNHNTRVLDDFKGMVKFAKSKIESKEFKKCDIFKFLSSNPLLKWEHVKNNPNLDWNWFQLSKHPNVTAKIIKDHPDLPWVWDSVVQNPNITSFQQAKELSDELKSNEEIYFIAYCGNPNIEIDELTTFIHSKNVLSNLSSNLFDNDPIIRKKQAKLLFLTECWISQD